MSLTFVVEPNAHPLSAAQRADLLVDPGFGRVFTDHMAIVRYSTDKGWHDARITARSPVTLEPAASVLHYAQEIFEGLKAYRRPQGAALFRPDANARRFRASARRLAMPELPEELFLESVRALVKADIDWIPQDEDGALYLRPFMFASEVFLGVKPASEYLYIVMASSVGRYFKGGPRAVSLWVTREYTRAAPGGTGAAKCGGNYAASLAAQADAISRGCDQVVFLDAAERRWIEELGGMNIFFVFDDGSIATPPLDGTILPGVTRDSILTLARDAGIAAREERYSIEQWQADAASGRLTEAFACGTAAVVTPIGRVQGEGIDFTINGERVGPTTQRIREALVAIQRGTAPDPHDWVEELA
ncbi:branched-chain amino acid aminotransferase [Sphingosinicella ginsenosidimutans]|nr:branched-chain amino acid aminotransferase [Sphingosinicella ginsenosidimutans]